MSHGNTIHLTREQVRRVDQTAIERYGIAGIVLMENAGRNATQLLLDRSAMIDAGIAFDAIKRIVIMCGSGNNGGDGFVTARHLANLSPWSVTTVLIGNPDRLSEDCRTNRDICRKMDIPIELALPAIDKHDLIIDAILGTGFAGNVREPAASIIAKVNAANPAGVVAIDMPSGLDCDTGSLGNVAIRAQLTITFVAAKVGFQKPTAAAYVGTIHVADIGAPTAIIRQILTDAEDQPH